MQSSRLLLLALLAAALMGGCVTEPEQPARVRLGMTGEDLRFFIGEPVRIEAAEGGGEIWYYRVVSPEGPYVDAAAWQDGYPGSGGVAVAVTPAEKFRWECPVFLSAEGRVTEPLPQASIRGR